MTISRRLRRAALPLAGTAFLALNLAPVATAATTDAATEEGSRRTAMSLGDREARRLYRMAERYIEQKEYDKGVRALENILEQYPESDVKYDVHLLLGRHFHEDEADNQAAIDWLKRNRELEQIENLAGHKLEVLLESFYLMGVSYYHQRQYGKLFPVLRKITSEHPNSVWANQAYYYIGMAHFVQKNWNKAIQYLSLVGTFVDPQAPTAEYVEAGRRFYVKVQDGDLPIIYKFGRDAQVQVESGSGDTEAITLVPLSSRQNLFIGSISTDVGVAEVGDGMLQVVGGDTISVTYADENTLEGRKDVPRSGQVKVVSSGSVAFTKGTYDEFAKAAFTGQPVYINAKDVDLDTSAEAERLAVRVVSRYLSEETVEDELELDPWEKSEAQEGPTWKVRDEVTLLLEEAVIDDDGVRRESGPVRSGEFIGEVDLQALAEGGDIDKSDDALVCATGDEVAVFYTDEMHSGGEYSREVMARIPVLGAFRSGLVTSGSEPRKATLKAKKNLYEGQAYLELSKIFKSMGLVDGAKERVDEGLVRADLVIGLEAIPPDLRQNAFKLRWELYLVEGDLEQAIATLSTFNQYFPESRFADQALLSIGKIHQEREEYAEAVNVYQRILELEQSEVKPEAQFAIAKAIEAEKGTLEPAIPAYKAVADNYGDSEYAGEALAKLVKYHASTGDYVQANDLLEQIFIDHPDKSWLDGMLLRWVILAYNMKDYRKALEKCQRLLFEYPDSPHAKKASEIMPKIEKKLAASQAARDGGN